MPSKKCLEHIAKRLAEKENGKRKRKKSKKPLTEEQKLKREMRRRAKISKTVRKKIKDKIEKARRDGYREWLKKKRAEIKERKKIEEREKKKEKKRKLKEKEALYRIKHRKKPGRKKKPGPKPKKKKKVAPKEPKVKLSYNYKIISCRNGKQDMFIGKYKTIQDAYEHFNYLKDNNNPTFPVLVTNSERMLNSINEYILIEKSDDANTFLRNEYGKLVEQKLNIPGWIVLDKFRYYKEETFGIFDYNVKSERKTFNWIYDNLLYDGIETKLDFKRVILYRNKIIFKDDNGYIDIVMCKCESDAVRFYNLLQEKVKKDKNKQILFLGDYGILGPHDETRNKLESEIQERTGWSLYKVRLRSTSKYITKKGENF